MPDLIDAHIASMPEAPSEETYSMDDDRDAPTTDPSLEMAMLIVDRCREEGRAARLAGEPQHSCPYSDALERAGWLDGWSRA